MKTSQYDDLLQKYLKGKSTRKEEQLLLNYLLLSVNNILQATRRLRHKLLIIR